MKILRPSIAIVFLVLLSSMVLATAPTVTWATDNYSNGALTLGLATDVSSVCYADLNSLKTSWMDFNGMYASGTYSLTANGAGTFHYLEITVPQEYVGDVTFYYSCGDSVVHENEGAGGNDTNSTTSNDSVYITYGFDDIASSGGDLGIQIIITIISFATIVGVVVVYKVYQGKKIPKFKF